MVAAGRVGPATPTVSMASLGVVLIGVPGATRGLREEAAMHLLYPLESLQAVCVT